MKIYPGTHKAYLKKQVSLEDLPLSCVSNNDTDRIIDIHIESEFGAPYKEIAVQPHQRYQTDQILFFDKAGNPVWNNERYLRKKGNEYQVLPEHAVEFYPKEFIYEILVRRDDHYKKTVSYPIEFLFSDIQDTEIKNALIALIQNTGSNRRYPANIIFNGGEVMPSALFPASGNYDFRFCAANDVTKLELDAELSNHRNLWLFDESFDGLLADTAESGSYIIKENEIFASAFGSLEPVSGEGHALFGLGLWSFLENEEYESIDFFLAGEPIRIYHKEGSGYLILSHPSFLKQINHDNNTAALHLFIETILYVYLHSYFQTKTATSFIADEIIDYYIDTSLRHNLSHPRLNLGRLLTAEGFNSQIGYYIIDVFTQAKKEDEIDHFTVDFIGVNRFGELLFKKKSEDAMKDPAKGNNVLVWTMDRTLAIYNPEDVVLREIESGITIRQIDIYHIGVSAARSSKHRIYTIEESVLELPKIGKFAVVYDTLLSMFMIIDETEDDDIFGDYIKIASVSVTINTDIVYDDIRICGGGEASFEPSYEMIDTGSIYGRPYRYGCPMIIKLPERYKPMQTEIRSEVEKHIASGDYPIILYKD